MTTISDAAINLIVQEEDSDATYYARHYSHFEWPGGASGPTVGIGYDCGYVTETELRADWTGIVDDVTIEALCKAIGHHGEAAHQWVRDHGQSVTITWDQAIAEFETREVPKWEKRLSVALPNTDLLSPDSRGALLSLAYNRGCSFDLRGDRYSEMREIKAAMASKDFASIPDLIRSMARLWTGGVAARRRHEAALFEQGLRDDNMSSSRTEDNSAGDDDSATRMELSDPSKAVVAAKSTSVWMGLATICTIVINAIQSAKDWIGNFIDAAFQLLPQAVNASTDITSALQSFGGMVRADISWILASVGIATALRFILRHIDLKHGIIKQGTPVP